MPKQYLTKLNANGFKVPVHVMEEKGRLYFNFPFNRALMAEIKSMHNARYHGYDDHNPRKIWSIKDCDRNRFQLTFLQGGNPYAEYERALKSVKANRGLMKEGGILYDHQLEMKAHGLTRRQCILACQMGTGKTLAAIEIMEDSGVDDWLWAGPKSALAAVELEFDVWDAKIIPRMFVTYERIRSWVKDGQLPFVPQGVVGDESTKVKTPTAQRSQSFSILVEEMRKQDPECYVILMSGAPAPKSPGDWWHQCEIARPGFIKEGDVHKFKNRMAIIREEESITGGVYPKLITWLDDEKKCNICGKIAEEHITDDMAPEDHSWQSSKNEVAYLYKRMEGLVLVKFKKDCLDLPEKQYKKIVCEPDELTQRALRLILANEPRTVTALMKARELSDGFQYQEKETGRTTNCSLCSGTGKFQQWYDPEYPDEVPSPEAMESGRCKEREEECYLCDGSGKVPELERIATETQCPKQQVFIDLLDEHEPIGRFVTYAGFRASVDRLVKLALKYQWDVLRVDGRGWCFHTGDTTLQMSDKNMLKEFQHGDRQKICFIGQPGSAGMGLTLTASPTCFFYSNSFNADDRVQAVERIHRPGMDVNRGATIVDVCHLYTDQYIIDNLEKKIDLQNLTMGQFKDTIKEYEDVAVIR